MRLPESPLAATHTRLAATTARMKRTRPRFMWPSPSPVGGDGPGPGSGPPGPVQQGAEVAPEPDDRDDVPGDDVARVARGADDDVTHRGDPPAGRALRPPLALPAAPGADEQP